MLPDSLDLPDTMQTIVYRSNVHAIAKAIPDDFNQLAFQQPAIKFARNSFMQKEAIFDWTIGDFLYPELKQPYPLPAEEYPVPACAKDPVGTITVQLMGNFPAPLDYHDLYRHAVTTAILGEGVYQHPTPMPDIVEIRISVVVARDQIMTRLY